MSNSALYTIGILSGGGALWYFAPSLESADTEKRKQITVEVKGDSTKAVATQNDTCLQDALKKGTVPDCGGQVCGVYVYKEKQSSNTAPAGGGLGTASQSVNQLVRTMLFCVDVAPDSNWMKTNAKILWDRIIAPKWTQSATAPPWDKFGDTFCQYLSQWIETTVLNPPIALPPGSIYALPGQPGDPKYQLRGLLKSILVDDQDVTDVNDNRNLFRWAIEVFSEEMQIAIYKGIMIGEDPAQWMVKNTWKIWNGDTTTQPTKWYHPVEEYAAMALEFGTLWKATGRSNPVPGVPDLGTAGSQHAWDPVNVQVLGEAQEKWGGQLLQDNYIASVKWSNAIGWARFARPNALLLLEDELNAYAAMTPDQRQLHWKESLPLYRDFLKFGMNYNYYHGVGSKMTALLGKRINVTGDSPDGTPLVQSYAWQTIALHMAYLRVWAYQYTQLEKLLFSAGPRTQVRPSLFPWLRSGGTGGLVRDSSLAVPPFPRMIGHNKYVVESRPGYVEYLLDFNDCKRPEAWDSFDFFVGLTKWEDAYIDRSILHYPL